MEKPYRRNESKAFDAVVNRILGNEPCVVVSMSGLGKRELYGCLDKYIANNIKNFSIRSFNITSFDEVQTVSTELESLNEKAVVLIKISFNGDCSLLFNLLNSLRVKYYTDFLPLVLCNLSNTYVTLEQKNKLVLKSQYILRPSDKEDINLTLDYFEQRYSAKLPPYLGEKFIVLSGGHTGFLKSLYFRCINSPKSTFEVKEFIKDESFLCWIEGILKISFLLRR